MIDDLLVAYSIACAFFGRVLQPGVDTDLLRQCAQERMFESWPLPASAGGVPPGLPVVAGALAALDDDRLAMIEEDNTVLFIGPNDPVPMWESVWTTEERLLFADCTAAVEQEFIRHGFQNPGGGREPADHLAYELAFVAALLARTCEYVRADDRDQAQRHLAAAAAFLHAHLCRWAGDCLRMIAERAGTDFYRGVAALCAATLDNLKTHLDMAVGDDRRPGERTGTEPDSRP
jgi:TorA maturation chaperone TorD